MHSDEFYSGRYIVIGPPGTGKTTFLSKQVRQVVDRFSGTFSSGLWPNPVMICSLTKAAAAEVAGRDLPIPKQAVGTLHAHCFRALNFPTILKKSHVDAWNRSSAYPLGSSEFGDDDTEGEETSWDRRADVNIVTDGDALLQRMEILRHKMVPRSSWDQEVLRFSEEWEEFKTRNGVMDFTDLIEIAFNTIPCAPGNAAVIMVDEAQDMSALEYSLIKSWSKRAKATIVVGDPWQALYTWRGADPGLFSDPSVLASHRRVLSQSYRVPERVLRVAVDWIKTYLSTYEPIEYAPRKKVIEPLSTEGAIGWRESTTHDTDDVVEEAIRHVASGRSVMFQTSCSYMLSGLIGNLRRKNVVFSNPWRKWRRDWNPLSGSAGSTSISARMLAFVRNCSDHPSPQPWSVKDVSKFVDPMAVTGNLLRGAKKKIAGTGSEDEVVDHHSEDGLLVVDHHSEDGLLVVDHHSEDGLPVVDQTSEDIHAERQSSPVIEEDLEEWFDARILPEIIAIWRGERTISQAARFWQDRLLATPRKSSEYPVGVLSSKGVEPFKTAPRVHVGTIHSFKGAEADVVYVFPDLSSAGFRQWESGNPSAKDEVVRLFYVALTRAVEQAYVCRNSGVECAPLRRFVMKFDWSKTAAVAATPWSSA